jgi:dimethylargininase
LSAIRKRITGKGMLTALTREVSPAMNRCELSYLERVEIQIAKAAEQHRQYENCLRAMGAEVISLPAEPELPDSVFVEDPAVVVDEVAILTRPGAESRRSEGESLAKTLARFRPLRRMQAPATLEGGDVMRAEKTLYVGASARTNAAGIAQLAEELKPYGYEVKAVAVRGCLHLKSGCCYLGNGIALANREWVDTEALAGLRIVDVASSEPWAANVLTIGEVALMPAGFPATAKIVERLGWKVQTTDISELRKAEAGVTCSSLVFV